MIDALLQHYRQASPDTIRAGLAWYALAADVAGALGEHYRVPAWAVAGVIAALSPNTGWSDNVRRAHKAIAAWHAGLDPADVSIGLGKNVRKAWAILEGAHPLDVLGGPKVRSFYANIAGDWGPVTVDRWAILAVDPEYTGGTPTPAQYARYAEAYTRAAALVGLTPAQFQAIIWVHVRGRAD